MPNCCVCNQPNRANAKFCAHCRAPLVLQNKYRITRLLGRGGYGAVYQAEQLHLGNALCAVKELLPDPKATPAQQQAASEQFRLEAGLLANLNHPALPKVTDFFTEGNSHFLVMEYVEGETLEDRLRRNGGPLPEAQVLAWANELCDVLTYLHTRQPSPIIHRDVKPANIKIMPDGKLKLIDFGISKVLAKGTGDAARAVSPPYSPLEQYGKGLRTDARSDLYALGVTLYELLTNQLPPEAPDRGTEAVLPPRQFNPALSPHIEAVILKAIAEKADERYQSAAEMKVALAPPPPPPPPVPQPTPVQQPLPQTSPTPVGTPIPAAKSGSSGWGWLALLLVVGGMLFGVQEISRQQAAATATAQANATATVRAILATRPSNVTMTVYADRDWQDTGMFVLAGEKVSIEYISGNWCAWPGGCSNPYEASGEYGYLFGLRCRVNDSEISLYRERFIEVKFNSSGYLHMRIADRDTRDNSGSIIIFIQVK